MFYVNFSTDTSIYASGDVLADFQLLTPTLGREMLLQSFSLYDQADLATPLRVVFAQSAVSMGAENAAPSISDTDGLEMIGEIAVASGDWTDYGGIRFASKLNVGLVLPAAPIYVGLLNSTTTPTYLAGSLHGRFALRPFV